MNEHKFYSGPTMKSIPTQRSRGTNKNNRKTSLLGEVAKLKHHLTKEHDLEYWLYFYSDYTLSKLQNELNKLTNGDPNL